ncbi:MAG: YidC/Oxa1 family membrane protein insertase [Acutalibacteraceae bacterium]|jgi:YidC/Oxa1 family membrane protein insertase
MNNFLAGIGDIFAAPFGWILAFLYSFTDNYVLSLVILTVIFKVILLPTAIKQQKGAAKQLRLQNKVNKIKEKYAGDNRKIQEETQALYQREGYSAMTSGCAPALISLPIMMGLYGVVYTPLSSVLRISEAVIAKLSEIAYGITSLGLDKAATGRQIEIKILENFDLLLQNGAGEVLTPELIESIQKFNNGFRFMGIYLADAPKFSVFNVLWLIPILAGVTSVMSTLFMLIKQRKTNPAMANPASSGCMALMPVAMSVYFTFLFPAGVGVYWIISNILQFIQQVILSYTHNPHKLVSSILVDETVQRRSRENNIKHLKALREKQGE